MSHYKANSPLSQVNREAAQHPVAVPQELFDFIADAMRYHASPAARSTSPSVP
jgi:thiamine biosynthesis lipoprotein ApbE